MTIKILRSVGKVYNQDERDVYSPGMTETSVCHIRFPVSNRHLQSRDDRDRGLYGMCMVGMKLYLSYTAQGIVNVWVFDIRHRQNPLPSESGVGNPDQLVAVFNW